MTLSKIERQILRGALAELKRAKALKPMPGVRCGGFASVDEYRAAELAAEGIVKPAAARWVDHDGLSDAAVQMRVSRAYKALEAKGLVERVSVWDSGRMTHLRLTEAGQRACY